jgi:ABC-type branched-subunit amino acid transport system ATPase component
VASTTFHIPDTLLREIDRAARRMGLSRNRFVIQACGEALAVADRAYVLSAGKVVLAGTGAQLRSTPELEQAYLSTAPEAKR